MKKVLPFAVAALLIPSVAFARGKPPTAGTHTNHGKAKVQYILHGTLSSFSAFDSGTNGSITIDVLHANRHGRVLDGSSLTFDGMVTDGTRVVLADGVTMVADNDHGIVKVRAPKEPKDVSATDLATILTGMPVRQVIDRGASS